MAKKKKKSGNFLRYLMSILILGSAIGVMVMMTTLRQPPEESDNSNLQQTVTTFQAEEFTDELELDVFGIVEAHREIDIASQVTGEVVEKTDQCRAGRFVRKGELLLRIDSTNYDLAHSRLLAEKASAEAGITELEQELTNLNKSIDLVTTEYSLQKQDYERKMNAGSALSRSERDQALRALTTAERQMEELKNTRLLTETRRVRMETAIELAKVGLKEAELNQSRCEIKAPFDGVVVSDPVEQGDYLTTGKVLVVFEDTSKADVKCNLRFEQLQQIVKYQVPDSRAMMDPNAAYRLPPTIVKISRKTEDDRLVSWEGLLNRFDGIGVDAQTKMIPCRIEVAKPVTMSGGRPRALVRGMFVTVQIPLTVFQEGGESILTFPAIAIRPGNQVWEVKDGKLKRHAVEILDRKNTDDPDPRKRMVVVRVNSDVPDVGPWLRTWITQGRLHVGSQVVTSPLAQPNQGLDVTNLSDINESEEVQAIPDSASESGDGEQTSNKSSSGGARS